MEPTSKLPTPTRNRCTRRRGSLYIAVMGVSMIVGVMSLAAIHLVRMTLKEATGRNDRYQAAVLGSSAVENGLIVLANDPNWRTTFQSGVEYPSTPVTLGGGTFTWKLVDDDGNLADDLSDTVLLQGIGRFGDVTHVEQVRLQPTDVGLTCLEASLHSSGPIVINNVTWTTNQFVSTNNSSNFAIDRYGSGHVDGNAEAVGGIQNPAVTGSKTTGITPRQMPGSYVFDYYVNLGTMIDINLLPSTSGNRLLEKVVLSPQSNPYGNPNPEGIYVIDCQGGNLWVRDLRIVGTLVLLNTGAGSKIDHEVHFEPSIPNYPSLLVSGNIKFQYNSQVQLNEVAEGVNFNPVGTPYQGSEDSDTLDNYPSVIKGLVYVSGELNLVADALDSAVDGVVVCGSIAADSNFILTYRSWFLNYPPPGFASGSTMEILPGSWIRTPSP